jgi:ATP-dependent Clp protease protease subunit
MSNQNEFRKFAVHHLGMSGNSLDSYTKYMNENPYTVTGMTPNIVEERQMRATVIDVFSRLMADRIIFFGTPVDDYIANVITAQLAVFGIIRS